MDQTRRRVRVAPNLYTSKTRAGTELYVVRWMVGKKAIERSLGPASLMTLKQAKARAAALIATETEPVQKKAALPTFADVAWDALAEIERAKHWRNPRSAEQWRNSLRNDALPVLGRMRIDEVSRDDVLKVLRPIWDTKPESAKRLQQRLASIFDWAIMRRFRQDNPAAWRSNLAFALPPRSRVQRVEHHDAPSIEELRKVVAYCRAHPSPVSGCLLLVIATVCRVSEARQATADQISGDVWTVPGAAQKVDRGARRVPLSALGLDAVSMASPDGLLFRGLRGGMVCLDAPRQKLCKIINRDTTAHGIRSTFRDWAPGAGIDRDTAERCLSHEVGSDTERAYLRRDFLEERRAALELWAKQF